MAPLFWPHPHAGILLDQVTVSSGQLPAILIIADKEEISLMDSPQSGADRAKKTNQVFRKNQQLLAVSWNIRVYFSTFRPKTGSAYGDLDHVSRAGSEMFYIGRIPWSHMKGKSGHVLGVGMPFRVLLVSTVVRRGSSTKGSKMIQKNVP